MNQEQRQSLNYASPPVYRRSPNAIAVTLGIMLQLAGCVVFFIGIAAIGLDIKGGYFDVRSVAFAVPGAIGFQEAAYALLGPLFGLPPPAALALSLARRARDILLGVIGIASWQAVEAVAWSRRRSG